MSSVLQIIRYIVLLVLFSITADLVRNPKWNDWRWKSVISAATFVILLNAFLIYRVIIDVNATPNHKILISIRSIILISFMCYILFLYAPKFTDANKPKHKNLMWLFIVLAIILTVLVVIWPLQFLPQTRIPAVIVMNTANMII